MRTDEQKARHAARQRERYANDPEHRAKKDAANRAYAKKTGNAHGNAWHAKKRREDPEYAERRRAASRAGQQRRREEVAEYIKAIKDSEPCVDCGQSFPHYCMEFAHVSGVKLFGIAKAVAQGGTLKRAKEEVAKCEIRCVICHRIRHYGGEPVCA